MEVLKEIERYAFLTIGAIIQGIAMSLFLFPHGIPSGGAAGIALLSNHWLNLSLGISLWIANFALLAAAIYWFGYAWTIRTMFSVSVTSFTVQFFETYMTIPHYNLLLDILFGGLFFGIGVGILIRNGASSGGMVILALIIASLKKSTPGKATFWINFTIFLITASVIEWKIVFYAIGCQWLSTKTIDIVYSLKLPPLMTDQMAWRKK